MVPAGGAAARHSRGGADEPHTRPPQGWCEDAEAPARPEDALAEEEGGRTGFKTTKVRKVPVAPVVQHAKQGGVQGLGWRRATVHQDEDGDEADEFFDEHGNVVRPNNHHANRRTV